MRPDDDLNPLVRELLDELPDPPTEPGVVSVWCGDLDGAAVLAHRADETHYAASTMKLPLVLAGYRLHERGLLDLDTEVEVHNRFVSASDGSPYSLDEQDDQDPQTWAQLGGSCSLRTLADRALSRSSNLATNLLLEHVGAGAVAEVLVDAGCSPATMVVRGIEDAAAREAGLDNLVTARDLGLLLAGVARRTVLGADSCREVEEVLARQEHRDGIPRGLPAGTYVANKTGWVEGITHDVAVVRPDGRPPFVLAVLTTVPVSEEAGELLVARLARAVWDRVRP